MRADRLVATLLLLQSRGLVSARELAEELEVSTATARRDLEALSTAGIPVYPQRGRGGGWTLLGGARTDLSGLSHPEMQALFLLIGPAAAVSPAAKAALRKLVRALPATFRAHAESASAAVIVDAARWGDSPPETDDRLDTLRSATVTRRRLTMDYHGRSGSIRRQVEPWGLVQKDRSWYLVAGTSQGRRTFRVDRMADVVVSEEGFEPPVDFRLADAWVEISAEVEGRRSGASADVTIPADLVDALRRALGARHVVLIDTVLVDTVLVDTGLIDNGPTTRSGDDAVRLRVTSDTPAMLARQLAGWAPELEVVGPPEVRVALAALGRELVGRYAG